MSILTEMFKVPEGKEMKKMIVGRVVEEDVPQSEGASASSPIVSC